MDDGVESIDDLGERIRGSVRIDGEEETEEVSDGNEFYDVDDANVMEQVGVEIGSGNEGEDEKDEEEEEYDDDEFGVLEAMVSGRKNKKNETFSNHSPPMLRNSQKLNIICRSLQKRTFSNYFCPHFLSR